MAGVGAASGMTMGVMPAPARTRAASATKAFAQEARIAADQHAMWLGLGLDVCGNAGHGEADVGHRKFVGNNGAPSGGAEFDR